MFKVKAKYDAELQTAIDSYIKAVQAIRSEYKESIAAEKVKEHNQKLRDKATEIRKAYEAELDTLHDKTKKELEQRGRAAAKIETSKYRRTNIDAAREIRGANCF